MNDDFFYILGTSEAEPDVYFGLYGTMKEAEQAARNRLRTVRYGQTPFTIFAYKPVKRMYVDDAGDIKIQELESERK